MSANDELTEGTNPNFLKPGQKVGGGNFTLIKMLGRGGMGVVWLARDESLNEDVALKFLPPEVAADAIALDDLRRETRKSRRLTHPQIMRIHAFHGAPGEPAFISMEFVDGPNLTSLRLQQQQRCFTWKFLEPLMRQLCGALDYAHGEKIIHRDLKPSNLMLDARGRLKLADFGIAATMSDSMNRVSLQSATSGTLVYMSPQQLRGETPRATDDIYALGATFYELLTSKPPFFRGDIADQVKHEPPQLLAERLHDFEITNPIPEPVKELIMACLAKEAAQRPQSTLEILKRLDAPAATAKVPLAPVLVAQTTLEITPTIPGPPPTRNTLKPSQREASPPPALEEALIPATELLPRPEPSVLLPNPAITTDEDNQSTSSTIVKDERERSENERPFERPNGLKMPLIGTIGGIISGFVRFWNEGLGTNKVAGDARVGSSGVINTNTPVSSPESANFPTNTTNERSRARSRQSIISVVDLVKAAEKGDSEAMNELGDRHLNGRGATLDYGEAVKWFRKSAQSGNSYGAFDLGTMYENGLGVTQDYSEAVKYYRKAAMAGNTDAENNLGAMFAKGLGVNQDYNEAVKWYGKAAQTGNLDGEINLGAMYESGHGVTQDYNEAVKWFRKAAVAGDARGQSWLGYMHENGYGEAQDREQAIQWYQKAAAQNDTFAQSALKRLAQ